MAREQKAAQRIARHGKEIRRAQKLQQREEPVLPWGRADQVQGGYAPRRGRISIGCLNLMIVFSGATPRHCVPG